VNFFCDLRLRHILRVNCAEMAGDRPGQPTYEIFGIERRLRQSKSWPPKFKEAGAGGHQRLLPPKVFFYTTIISCSVNRLQIGTDVLLIVASNSNKLFIGVNGNDLEWPWTPKITVFVIFLWFLAVTHIIKVNCTEMAGDGPGQPAYDIFLA